MQDSVILREFTPQIYRYCQDYYFYEQIDSLEIEPKLYEDLFDDTLETPRKYVDLIPDLPQIDYLDDELPF